METKKHRDRKDLVGEHRLGDAGQVFFAILFFIVYIADSFVFRFTTFLNGIVPDIIRDTAGIIVLIASGYLSGTGLRIVFKEVREKPEVIRKGVFSYVRHPVYLGEILLYLGLLFFSLSAAAFLVWLLILFFLNYISCYEEKILVDHFGDEYRNYMKEVPRWIPSISRLLRKTEP